jgi:DNA topoisomerase-3
VCKEKGVLSYGPCQFPTLGFVVERYLKILNFQEETFYYISMTHEAVQLEVSHKATFKWKRDKVYDRSTCLCLYEACIYSTIARVVSVEARPSAKNKPLPLTTVELQKRCSKWLHLSSEQTMKAAESLYNKGYISYPRTETSKFKDGTDLRALLELQQEHNCWGRYIKEQLFHKNLFEAPRNGIQDDQAHPPIHPTKCVTLESIQDINEKKLYEFVVLHFLACCSKNAKGSLTTVQALVGTETFMTSGLMILERNYLDIYRYEKWTGNSIPVYQIGHSFIPTTFTMETGHTAPPALLTEADLISKMDSNGIGTDATIADHIKTILKREYAVKVKDNSRFQPTALGLALVQSYERMGLELAKPRLRAEVLLIFQKLSLKLMGRIRWKEIVRPYRWDRRIKPKWLPRVSRR